MVKEITSGANVELKIIKMYLKLLDYLLHA